MTGDGSKEFIALKLVLCGLLSALKIVDAHFAQSIAESLRETLEGHGDDELTGLVEGIIRHVQEPPQARARFDVIDGGKVGE